MFMFAFIGSGHDATEGLSCSLIAVNLSILYLPSVLRFVKHRRQRKQEPISRGDTTDAATVQYLEIDDSIENDMPSNKEVSRDEGK